jgi:hypothetical protein
VLPIHSKDGQSRCLGRRFGHGGQGILFPGNRAHLLAALSLLAANLTYLICYSRKRSSVILPLLMQLIDQAQGVDLWGLIKLCHNVYVLYLPLQPLQK